MNRKDKVRHYKKDRKISINSTIKSKEIFIQQVEPDRVIKYQPYNTEK